MDRMAFMLGVKEILEEVSDADLQARADEMKGIIDNLVRQEINFAKAGLR